MWSAPTFATVLCFSISMQLNLSTKFLMQTFASKKTRWRRRRRRCHNRACQHENSAFDLHEEYQKRSVQMISVAVFGFAFGRDEMKKCMCAPSARCGINSCDRCTFVLVLFVFGICCNRKWLLIMLGQRNVLHTLICASSCTYTCRPSSRVRIRVR